MTLKRRSISPLVDPFNMFESLFSDPFAERTDGVSLKSSVENIDNKYIFTVELPGFDSKEIDIQVRNGLFKIVAEHAKDAKGKFFHSCVERAWTLPEAIDPDNIDAQLKNGVLTVTLLRKNVEQRKRIEIKSAE
jgi:HSP20 family protein